ncbi:Aste57867_923 [Aphanomyces stellatus]|uniref:Aste57867_923 protein n=1 Tax=Aphanomyces stellatus TaxID=120398 RepID=A0A485K949_9STRA|nr:hypothetical protein As57867_000922 [Aphanomyces stellatus]VFT78147.1 Aste57867_923 [Aphanomyces stellatus]
MLHRAVYVLAALLAHVCVGSIYHVENEQVVRPYGSNNPFEFAYQRAEKMFATNNGPFLAKAGESTVELQLAGQNVDASLNGYKVVVFHYHADDLGFLTRMEENLFLFACNPQKQVFATNNYFAREEFEVVNQSLHVNTSYRVLASGWIDTVVAVCTPNRDRGETALDFTGTLTVTNPYGFLPAVFYGFLPGFLALGYLVLLAFYAILLCYHRDTVIRLQFGIFSVLGLGVGTSITAILFPRPSITSPVAASAIWFLALNDMNQHGQPFQWPLPPFYIAAVVFDVGMRTLARLLLLVVCLGYGIVRDSLQPIQKLLIVLLSLAYFGTGIADDLWRDSAHRRPNAASFVQLLCNLSFVLWIYVALENIIKELGAQKQSAKLGMYKSLACALGAFVVFFFVLTVVAVCGRMGVVEWKIEYEWMQLVAWPVLNFIVSMAMCFIWRPSARSSQFAFSTQLPMSEEAADESGDEKDIELANRASTFTIDDIESEDEEIKTSTATAAIA